MSCGSRRPWSQWLPQSPPGRPGPACRKSVSSLGDLEAIASAAHGLQVTRGFRLALDFFTQLANVDINGAFGNILRVAPYSIEQLPAGEDPAGVPSEVLQQAKLGSGGENWPATHINHHASRINLNLAGRNLALRQRTLEAAQHRLNARHQLARAKRLADVIVGAQLQAGDAIGFRTSGGEKNHWRGRQRWRLSD